MRRKDREVTAFADIVAILDGCAVLHLAMISDGAPYVVPVNFGYTVQQSDGVDTLTLYIHGAGEGKKIAALQKNPHVSFCAETMIATESAGKPEDACEWTCYYKSVIGSGTVRMLSGNAERAAGLDAVMMHNGYKLVPGVKTIAYAAMALARTAVMKIEVSEITGKQHVKK